MENSVLVKTAVIAAVLFILFAFFFESAPTAFVVFAILSAAALFRKNHTKETRMKKVVIYLVMFMLTLGITSANGYFAKRSAGRIIAAAEGYARKTGAYPGQLSDLVPEFLPKVPAAKYTFLDNGFKYIARGKQHILIYVKKPPYGRAYYNFEEKKWGTMD